MKKYLLHLLLLTFVFSSCTKTDDLYDDFSDQNGQVDDDWDDDNWTDDEDGSGNTDMGEEGALTLYKVDGATISKIKDYQVTSNLVSFQNDVGTHFEMWDFVTRLIPTVYRDKISEFEVFHGNGQLLGYVLPPNEGDLSKWRFGLAIDAIDGDLSQVDLTNMFTYVTIHEYGHVLTLNDSQLNVGDENCGTYHTGEGCSNPNSYINKLYDLGWEDIANDPSIDEPFDLYNKYQNRFVSDYAATNPAEDIAEVFSFFVTMPERPSGNRISDQKINLLNSFPELVTLREDIRSSGPALNLRPGSWVDNPLMRKFKVCGRKGCKRRHHKVKSQVK